MSLKFQSCNSHTATSSGWIGQTFKSNTDHINRAETTVLGEAKTKSDNIVRTETVVITNT